MSSESSNSDVWPPANFTDWPGTRIGALIIDGIILLLMIIPWTRRVIFVNSWKECCGCGCYCHELIKAIALGFILGMFLHFVPCIWWTCDWGEYDGEGVRGFIWVVSGFIIGFLVLWLECQRSRRRSGRRSFNSRSPNEDAAGDETSIELEGQVSFKDRTY